MTTNPDQEMIKTFQSEMVTARTESVSKARNVTAPTREYVLTLLKLSYEILKRVFR